MASAKRVNKEEEEEEGDNSPIHEEKGVKIDEGGGNEAMAEQIIREFEARREANGTGLPFGFRFSPTDVEVVDHYLKNKILGKPLSSDRIKEIDLNEDDPDELPVDKLKRGKMLVAYFFTNLERKYTKGQLPSRTTKSGYWKATGNNVPIFSNNVVVGFKKILNFFSGEEPCGKKTCWVMHEFRVNPNNIPVEASDDSIMAKIERYVVCRMQKKKVEKNQSSSESD